MMTETEAKTKACFRAATFGGSQQLANGPGPHCIASGCMAWRWDINTAPFAVHRNTLAIWEARGYAVIAEHGEHKVTIKFAGEPTGFCGLAEPRLAEVTVQS